jgi:hypothetical protein
MPLTNLNDSIDKNPWQNDSFSNPSSLKQILILSSHLHLSLQSGPFLTSLQTKISHHPMRATRPVHLISRAKGSAQARGAVYHLLTCYFLCWRVLHLMHDPQAGGPLLVGCPRLLTQHICSYPPYLETSSPICKLKMRHTAVARGPLNIFTSVLVIHDRTDMSHSTFKSWYGVVKQQNDQQDERVP